jgi:predicted alpha/beta-hydrolase family hydrolase
VPTPQGPARVRDHPAAEPTCRLVLGHGAGGSLTTASADLDALASGLPHSGCSVVLVDQPWRVAGRRVAPAPSRLDEAWTAVLDALPGDVPLVVGGRSAGARVACRTAGSTGAVAVVALAYPLHPPGRPERSRAGELLAARVPTLVVQGRSDAFGRPDELPAAPGVTVVPVDGDHALRADPPAVLAAVVRFLTERRLVLPQPRPA